MAIFYNSRFPCSFQTPKLSGELVFVYYTKSNDIYLNQNFKFFFFNLTKIKITFPILSNFLPGPPPPSKCNPKFPNSLESQ